MIKIKKGQKCFKNSASSINKTCKTIVQRRLKRTSGIEMEMVMFQSDTKARYFRKK